MSKLPRPSSADILPLFAELVPAELVKTLVRAAPVKLYWRLLTPLVMLFMFVFQRLNADHSCDAAVAFLHSGAADALIPLHPKQGVLSQRLQSQSSSAYSQGRLRLPLQVIQGAVHHVAVRLCAACTEGASAATWHGHSVRLLDGTTFRLLPTPAIAALYPPARNPHGASGWPLARSVVAFDAFSQA